LVLIGPGGVGKTRLAVEVGWRAGDRFEKVAFIPLARVGAAEGVVPAICERLGVGCDTRRDPVESIAIVLGRASTLLILDNFEHRHRGRGPP
jgi:predicted ATPase